MEIINVEAQTFEAMMARFEAFANKVDALCRENGDKLLQKWLDNQEICDILNVSKRTLQNYRDCGMLAFTQIGHKMFYRPQDIEKLINKLNYK